MQRIDVNRMDGLSAYKLSHLVSSLVFVRPNLRGQLRPDKIKKAVLRALCDRYPNIWPGVEDIAAKASCSMPQARRVLRELEYKDRLIVDVNSRLEWRWPCECKHPCEHKPTLAPVVSGKRGGRGRNCTPQYMVNDRRILDIVEQQRMWDRLDEIPEANKPDHARSETRSSEVEQGEGVQIIPKTRSYENSNPIISASENAKPDQGDRRTYKGLTDNLVTGNGNRVHAAQIAAPELTAPGAANAAKVKVNTQETEWLLHTETELRREQAEQGDRRRAWRIEMLWSGANAKRAEMNISPLPCPMSNEEMKACYEEKLTAPQIATVFDLFSFNLSRYHTFMESIGETPKTFKPRRATPATRSVPSPETPDGYRNFQQRFKAEAGITPKEYRTMLDLYRERVERYGETTILNLIAPWVRKRGGIKETRSNEWSAKNFLDGAPDMLDTIRAEDIGPPRNGPVYLREEPRGPLTGEGLKEHEKEAAAFRTRLEAINSVEGAHESGGAVPPYYRIDLSERPEALASLGTHPASRKWTDGNQAA